MKQKKIEYIWSKQFHKTEAVGYVWLAAGLIYICAKGLLERENGGLNLKRVLLTAVIWLFSIWCIHWKNELSDRIQKRIALVVSIGSPFILFLILEINFHSLLLSMQMKTFFILLNLALLGSFSFLSVVLWNRFHAAVLCPLVLWYLFSVANLYVLRFRGTALLFTDFFQIKSALAVAGTYDYSFDYRMLAILFLVVDYMILICKLKNIAYFHSRKVHLLAACFSVLSVAFCCGSVVFGDTIVRHGGKINQYLAQRSYSQYGTSVTIIGSAKYLQKDEPQGYSTDVIDEIVSQYPSDAADSANRRPALIVIMDEAFTDFQNLYHLKTSEDTLPFYGSLKDNVVEGTLYVSIYGGGTANTEYEFLTGNSAAFVAEGAIPYQSYLKKDEAHISVVRNLKDMGYHDALALHPFNSKGYNRTNAYQALGFDDFLLEDCFEKPQRLRKYISDISDVEKVIALYEEYHTAQTPLFLFNVTMQNHSPYQDLYDNLPLDITVKNKKYADMQNLQIYINLLRKSDEAYEHLITYFEKQEEPVVIVFFGDHQPNIPMKRNKKNYLQNYQVPFKIWANYEIKEQQIDKISPNYLGVKLMELMDAPLTGYQKFLLELYEEVPVLTKNGYITKEGALYDVGDETAPCYDKIMQYRFLQYNNLFDKKHTRESFFYLD